jgi:hypothetical protein
MIKQQQNKRDDPTSAIENFASLDTLDGRHSAIGGGDAAGALRRAKSQEKTIWPARKVEVLRFSSPEASIFSN